MREVSQGYIAVSGLMYLTFVLFTLYLIDETNKYCNQVSIVLYSFLNQFQVLDLHRYELLFIGQDCPRY